MAALAALYLPSLGDAGFLGPDEPRYASIGRQMAASGDWITPRLDGQPWFEKPPLLYWMTAAGHLAGLPDEWAARLPVALASLAFLWFFHTTVAREFSRSVALAATAILGTSAGWAAFSFAAVTDLPMSAALNASMLIALFGPAAVRSREHSNVRHGVLAGVLLGLAVLAKGLVPMVLIAPAFAVARGKRLAMLLAAPLVAGPWYLLCWIQNGSGFWSELLWKHHVQRFFQSDLEHAQPIWYFAPVLLAGLYPFTPMAALLARARTYEDARVRFLILYVAVGLAFFSLSTNKLPGYVLPLLPALAVVLAVALHQQIRPSWWLGASAALLAAVPAIAAILPDALNAGLTRTSPPFALGWPFLLAAVAVGWLAWRGRVDAAVLTAALAAVAAVAYLKWTAFPALDQQVSARGFWRLNQPAVQTACIDPGVDRDRVYGLNYYAGRLLSACGGSGPRIVMRGGRLDLARE
jgi:4-amino-4-deoxy-L-arabinose transferase-like glycosyltransferase